MGKQKIGKAKEIYDAKIQFVSLVDAAANKRKFLMTKSKDGSATFVNYGRILKTDAESHYVTGIVYEPMTEDTDGEFMTAEEIRKAAYYYVKNFEKVDIQHSFVPDKNCAVVESWIAKADFSIGNEQVKEGSWLMTVEITDNDLWDKVEKGEFTGFSMGGICMCSEEEVELTDVTKKEDDRRAETKGIIAKLAGFFGFDVVEKGTMAEIYTQRVQGNNFWTALDSFESSLRHYDYNLDRYVYETDEGVIKEALEDFSSIITGLLTGSQPIAKAIEGPEKVGKSIISNDVMPALQDMYDNLGSIIKASNNTECAEKCEGEQENNKNISNKEDKEVKRVEAEDLISKAVAEALGQNTDQAEEVAEKAEKEVEDVTPELLKKMVAEAVAKAQQPEEKVSIEDVQDMVQKAVEKAMEGVYKANRLPNNLNSETVEKSGEQTEEHYLHGLL